LVGKRFDQLDLLLAEGPLLSALQGENADNSSFPQ
jgi:hypothetical protein